MIFADLICEIQRSLCLGNWRNNNTLVNEIKLVEGNFDSGDWTSSAFSDWNSIFIGSLGYVLFWRSGSVSKAEEHCSGELLTESSCSVWALAWSHGEFRWMVNVEELQMLYRCYEQGKQWNGFRCLKIRLGFLTHPLFLQLLLRVRRGSRFSLLSMQLQYPGNIHNPSDQVP